ncbi:hypothetical protein HMPREF0201_01893 [Cedecea davisae DSM 4568]|uniref:Uncharacterized protein n=1 Tax=Cedecea davisae DSM 4568 TaxID=566551 RepID=S3JXY9_9ENTR|nr:hypothetical protein HMPREF0201_01893 [Cedecea davisae DSM 4568]
MLVDIPAAQHNMIFFITFPLKNENLFQTTARLFSMYENYFHDRDLRWIIDFPNSKAICSRMRYD